jgi:hypothetical protein
MASPSKLDRLYRFFRHEEDGSRWGCYWNVSAGSLEKRQRLYRILYKTSDISLQDEITIDVKKPEDLKDFFVGLLEILQREDIDPAFQKACADVMIEDPWLSLFSFGAAATAIAVAATVIKEHGVSVAE